MLLFTNTANRNFLFLHLKPDLHPSRQRIAKTGKEFLGNLPGADNEWMDSHKSATICNPYTTGACRGM